MARFEPLPDRYVLYGADFSLYTCKLRAYLNKKGLPYEQRTASLWTYRNFIVPRTGVAMIPVLQTPDDVVWQDTTAIIDLLETQVANRRMVPDTPCQRLVALIMELFGDEFVLLPAMHHRWNHEENLTVIFEQFGRLAVPWLPAIAQRAIGKSLGARFRGYVPRLGITNQTMPAIDYWYEGLLSELDALFAAQPFVLGTRPSLADFGLAGPFCGHLAQDPWPAKHLADNAPHVQQWVERMNSTETFDDGRWLADDQLHDLLLPILRRFCRDHLPLLQDSVARLANWGQERESGKQVGRSIGEHEMVLTAAGGSECRATKAVTTYPIWMYQRPHDYYHSATAEQRRCMDALLTELDAPDAFSHAMPARLLRRNNRLYLQRS